MREIKFRAKPLTEDEELVYFELYEVTNYYPSDGVFYVGGIPYKVGSEQQYTGLKDKNGKEIYEGDAISICIGGKEYFQEIYEVKYSPYRACWQLAILKKANHVDSPIYIANHFTQGEADAMEVIGNIHENPELLKEK